MIQKGKKPSYVRVDENLQKTFQPLLGNLRKVRDRRIVYKSKAYINIVKDEFMCIKVKTRVR